MRACVQGKIVKILKNANLQIALGAAFLAVTGNGIMGPILSSLEAPMGRPIESLSYILTVFTFAVIVFTPVLGIFADRFGRRRVLLPAIFLFGAGALIPLVDNFALILTFRALQGIAVAGMASLAVTLIGDLYSGDERARAMSLRSGVHSLGFAVSPIIAGALASIDLMYPFYFFSVALPLFAYAYFRVDIEHSATNDSKWKYLKDIWDVLQRRQTWAIFYSTFHVFVIIYIMLVFVPILLAKKYGLAPVGTGAVLTFFFLSAALVSVWTQSFMEMFRDQHIIVGGFAVAGLLMILMPFVDSFAVLIAMIALWAVAHGVSFTPVYVLASALTPAHLRAGAVGGAFVATYLGATASPAIFLPLYGATENVMLVFIVAGIYAQIPLLLALLHMFPVEEKPIAEIFGE